MKSIEKEIKYILTEEQFEKVHSYFEKNSKKASTKTHVNYYIDSTDGASRLKTKGISSRIREIAKDKFEFTVKKKIVQEANTHIKQESTCYINPILANKLINGESLNNHSELFDEIKCLLDSDEYSVDFKVIGKLFTERTLFKVSSIEEPINFDVNSYLGNIDYEIEWETDNLLEAENYLLSVFKFLEITADRINTDSKSARFFKYYNKNR